MRLTILFFCLVNFLIAQKSDLTGGIIAFNKQDIETAKELIDIAYDKYMKKIADGNQDKPKIISKFWHYRGQIYFQLRDLDIAVQSFLEDISESTWENNTDRLERIEDLTQEVEESFTNLFNEVFSHIIQTKMMFISNVLCRVS